jgi:hypothetical protein
MVGGAPSNGSSAMRWILSAGEEHPAYTATSRQDIPQDYYDIYLLAQPLLMSLEYQMLLKASLFP